jgi:hypothetical protein
MTFSDSTGGRVSLTALALYLDFDAMEGLRDGQWRKAYRGSLLRMQEVNACGGPEADGEETCG